MQQRPAPTPRLVIFDLDGVIYRGDQPVPGAADLVAALHRSGRVVRFVTNNSMATRQEYVTRLARMGITTSVDEIVTSTSASIAHLRAHVPEVRRVLAVGAQGMIDELTAAGFATTPAGDAAPPGWNGGPLPDRYDAVLAGLDPGFDYRRLAAAAAAIREGARFVATNADARFPAPEGILPGAGSIIAAIRAASGREPLVIGKPQPGAFRSILDEAGVAAGEAIAIGDNPDSDVVAARRAGIGVVLVLTGLTDPRAASALDGELRPDWIAADPPAVAELLGVPLSR
jgi:phosphoglycolate/pyridoxal phosphate phosphatase family enzyme